MAVFVTCCNTTNVDRFFAEAFGHTRIITITDSWFGNNGLFEPLHNQLGKRHHMISQLHSNDNGFKLPGPQVKKGPGRPGKYGRTLGDASSLAAVFRPMASETNVNLGRPFGIATHLFIQPLCCNAVKFRQVPIQHYFLAANKINFAFDHLGWNC
jgi:hypothetical protein